MTTTTEIALREPMQLTSSNVERIFRESMAESTHKTPHIRGVLIDFYFKPSEVASHREDIISMLSVLPDEFYCGRGGGWTFLNLCIDRTGRQWTDSHQICDTLVCLGLAIGVVDFTFKQRELWQCFPGCMPYLTIDIKKGGDA